jgi:hypothetical protein
LLHHGRPGKNFRAEHPNPPPPSAVREASRLRQLVREFQKQNPGTVELDPDETNTTVEIDATAEAVESLRHIPGVGKVEEQRRHLVPHHRGPGQ